MTKECDRITTPSSIPATPLQGVLGSAQLRLEECVYHPKHREDPHTHPHQNQFKEKAPFLLDSR